MILESRLSKSPSRLVLELRLQRYWKIGSTSKNRLNNTMKLSLALLVAPVAAFMPRTHASASCENDDGWSDPAFF